jgi:hypothetical protein
MQGLEKVMSAGQHSIGLFTSEAGEFLGGHAMGKERITGTVAKLNSLWDGDGVERIRAGEEPIICRDRRLSLFSRCSRIFRRKRSRTQLFGTSDSSLAC